MNVKIALFTVFFLLLFGCVSYQLPEGPKNNGTVTPPPVELQCAEITDRAEGDRCYYNDAISKNNLTACSFIFSDSLRDACNLRFAINLNDSTLCGRILSMETRDDCYHTLAPVVGVVTCKKIENAILRKQCRLDLGDDTVLCEEMTDGYDFHLCMAKARNNESICAEIQNQSLTDMCYVEFAKNKNDYSICALPAGAGVRGDCYRYFAYLNSNSSLCSSISNLYTKYLCLTKLTGNYSLCNELPDYLQIDSCIEVFASDSTNYSLCSNISTHLYQDKCYTNIAVKSRNADICSRIICYECITDKDNCYYGVANVTGNISLCNRISEPMKKDSCHLNIAKSASNPSFCSKIENTYTMNTCYSSIIYNQNYTFSSCATIIHQNWEDECFKQLAINSKNSTVCQSITDPFVKNNCIRESS
ncbi:MAG: hypothetical protein Sv326_0855 [Candidatus Fermentimicrarchaeum limneticum]|uniref:Uncharacterized protein n=1 Tax=Fermentimicrarchaeum limneticum TaxID=2795018 RepID=A0A7D5XJX4_FERL1|nr:MAG: hypothetical protein Sv326_0855 [Candidatus Fermentimicrarchaeum limneticum]